MRSCRVRTPFRDVRVEMRTFPSAAAAAVLVLAGAARAGDFQQGPKLVATDSAGSAQQGASVGLSADGSTAIVGGPTDNDKGASFIFTRADGSWRQQGAKLVGTGGASPVTYQGAAVGISADGNTAIVGGHYDGTGVGAAWIFTRS